MNSISHDLVSRVMMLTKLNPDKTHDLSDTEVRGELVSLGFDPKEVVCSIMPQITFYRFGVARRYAAVCVELYQFASGLDGCQHELVTMRWEVGGGGMDSGRPYRYKLCCKCGYHPPLVRPPSWIRSAVRGLARWAS